MNAGENLHHVFRTGGLLMNTDTKRTLWSSVLAVFMFFCLSLSSVQADSDSDSDVKCIDIIVIQSDSTLLGPFGPGVGIAQVILDGQPMSVNAFAESIKAPIFFPDGSLALTLEETDTFPDGSTLTAIDQILSTPTVVPGIADVDVKVTWYDGTGQFEGAFGRYNGAGTVDFSTLQLTHSGDGVICTRDTDDDSD